MIHTSKSLSIYHMSHLVMLIARPALKCLLFAYNKYMQSFDCEHLIIEIIISVTLRHFCRLTVLQVE